MPDSSGWIRIGYPRILIRFKRDPPSFRDHSGKLWRRGVLRAGCRVALPEPDAAKFILDKIATTAPFDEEVLSA
jgi:hypothetical protein